MNAVHFDDDDSEDINKKLIFPFRLWCRSVSDFLIYFFLTFRVCMTRFLELYENSL